MLLNSVKKRKLSDNDVSFSVEGEASLGGGDETHLTGRCDVHQQKQEGRQPQRTTNRTTDSNPDDETQRKWKVSALSTHYSSTVLTIQTH